MSTTIIFATYNQSKAAEIRSRLPAFLQIQTLAELGMQEDIPEPYDNLKENAAAKSQTIHRLYHQNCFSEDTGLFVLALHGAPGVHSARYAGIPPDNNANIEKLLYHLQGVENRQAYFQTVISLIFHDQEFFFEGICSGQITSERIGDKGFGYDSIFIPDGSNKTFWEMELAEKNFYSHRRKATDQFITFLQNQPVWNG